MMVGSVNKSSSQLQPYPINGSLVNSLVEIKTMVLAFRLTYTASSCRFLLHSCSDVSRISTGNRALLHTNPIQLPYWDQYPLIKAKRSVERHAWSIFYSDYFLLHTGKAYGG